MMKPFSWGVFDENPVLVSLVGLCPALAASSRVIDALVMGLALFVILVICTVISPLLDRHIPERLRIFAYTAITGAFASCIDLFLQALMPEVSESLGLFVPLLTVNALILDRILNFARTSSPDMAFWDALSMGTGFFLALAGLALIREILGSGTITLFPMGSFSGVIRIPGLFENPLRVFGLSAGAFFVLGYAKAAFDLYQGKGRRR
ncbi:MAG: electron transport complex subunit RsxE [Spirochaetales bacterium]|jgi:electron transport complex protein RnfE|nr:electron transport complex subunit RsxE [Spirochaetales bacterium]